MGRGLIFFRFFSSHPDVIFMEGHTEEEEDTNQEVLNKLSRRHSYSNILDIQLGPHSSPETKKFKASLPTKWWLLQLPLVSIVARILSRPYDAH